MKTLRLFLSLAALSFTACESLRDYRVQGMACYPVPGGGKACVTVGRAEANAPDWYYPPAPGADDNAKEPLSRDYWWRIGAGNTAGLRK